MPLAESAEEHRREITAQELGPANGVQPDQQAKHRKRYQRANCAYRKCRTA